MAIRRFAEIGNDDKENDSRLNDSRNIQPFSSGSPRQSRLSDATAAPMMLGKSG